jgi:hypothetical protein
MPLRDQGQAREFDVDALFLDVTRIRFRLVHAGTGVRPSRLFRRVSRVKVIPMIRKLQSGEYRLYSRKVDPKTGKRRNLGTFKSRAVAEKHERDVQYFKRH